jgi:hypothetical protein
MVHAYLIPHQINRLFLKRKLIISPIKSQPVTIPPHQSTKQP